MVNGLFSPDGRFVVITGGSGILLSAMALVLALNLWCTLRPTQVFGKVMATQGTGSIINIASMASIRPLTEAPGYAAAKAAVKNLTE